MALGMFLLEGPRVGASKTSDASPRPFPPIKGPGSSGARSKALSESLGPIWQQHFWKD